VTRLILGGFQDAEVILLMRNEDGQTGEMELYVGKVRYEEVGFVEVSWWFK